MDNVARGKREADRPHPSAVQVSTLRTEGDVKSARQLPSAARPHHPQGDSHEVVWRRECKELCGLRLSGQQVGGTEEARFER
jgi:hypothetical protein